MASRVSECSPCLFFPLSTTRPSFGIQSVGVLTAPAVTGPYTFAAPCFQPDGQKSYDMGTFVDATGDGKAYLIRSVANQFAGVSQMTDE